MAYKCSICGANDVENSGDICELCAIGQDPYTSAMAQNATPEQSGSYADDNEASNQSNGSSSRRKRKILIGGSAPPYNVDPYGNDMTAPEDTSDDVQVYQAGQVPVTGNTSNTAPAAPAAQSGSGGFISAGITKNISIDTRKQSMFIKFCRSLFLGIPLSWCDDITMFQVFPDFSGTSLNAMGNACDQVIVYGRLNAGVISENNDVEVYGFRDSSNNVIAKKIKNKASGTIVTPTQTISASVVRVLFALALLLIAAMCFALGFEGIVWGIVIIACLTNLPLVFKILGIAFGAVFSIVKRKF